MGIFEVTARQTNVRREADKVKGTLEIEVKNPDFKHTQDFSYPTDGQTRLLDQDFAIGHINVVIKEEPHGQSCITGDVEVKIAGLGTKKDFDRNCVAITEAV